MPPPGGVPLAPVGPAPRGAERAAERRWLDLSSVPHGTAGQAPGMIAQRRAAFAAILGTTTHAGRAVAYCSARLSCSSVPSFKCKAAVPTMAQARPGQGAQGAGLQGHFALFVVMLLKRLDTTYPKAYF